MPQLIIFRWNAQSTGTSAYRVPSKSVYTVSRPFFSSAPEPKSIRNSRFVSISTTKFSSFKSRWATPRLQCNIYFRKTKNHLLVAIINSADNLTEELLRNTLGEFSCVGNEILSAKFNLNKHCYHTKEILVISRTIEDQYKLAWAFKPLPKGDDVLMSADSP